MSGTSLMVLKSWAEKFGKECHCTMYGSPVWLCSTSQWICIVNVSRASLKLLESGFTIHKATCTHRATHWEHEVSPMKSFIFYILYSQLLIHIVNHCATWDIWKWRHRENCLHTSRKSYILTLFYFEFTSPSGSLWVIRKEMKCIPILQVWMTIKNCIQEHLQ